MEVENFVKFFDENHDGQISFDEWMAGVAVQREIAAAAAKGAKNEVSSGSEFASGELYRHHIRRHTRMKHDPNNKYSQPLTAAQDVGWTAHEAQLEAPKAPKKSCAETVYAAELIKSGVFY